MMRNDLLTGEQFKPKRINQKFSSSKNRIKFYNQKASELRHSMMFINVPLQKNLKILNELMIGKNIQKFNKQYLLGKGYSFNVFTHYQKIENTNVPCIFNYAIMLIEGESITFIEIKN